MSFLFDNAHTNLYNLIATKTVAIKTKGIKRMKLSSKAHYGLMACYVLGQNYPNIPVSASALESVISVSGKYIEQIMRMLAKREIVTANRGANGGYFLKKPPERTTVGEIVRALEDDIKIIDCVGKNKRCKCCPTSSVWKKLYDGMNKLLDDITLKQVIDGEL